jgi:hypothetical protein
MNVANLIEFGGIKTSDVPDELKGVFNELVCRLERFRKDLYDQLMDQRTVYYVADEPMADAIRGVVPGDIAVWRGTDGLDHFKILGIGTGKPGSGPVPGANLITDRVSLQKEGGGANPYYIRDGRLTVT